MNSRIAVAVLFVTVLAVACAGPAPTTPDEGVVRLTETHTLGESIVVANLTVWPVFTDSISGNSRPSRRPSKAAPPRSARWAAKVVDRVASRR